jgi:hypothetical protein
VTTASGVRDARLAAALDDALAGGSVPALIDRLERSSGLPGRANLNLARAAAERIADAGEAGRELAKLLADEGIGEKRETALFLAYVGLSALALFAGSLGKGATRAIAPIHDACGDNRQEIREAARLALGIFVERAGDAALDAIGGFFDGYLHAHVALDTLSRREALDLLRRGDVLVERLEAAFALADAAPRAADRSQGVRTLRAGLPAQIAAFVGRFEADVVPWLEGWLDRAEHPLTRDVLHETFAALRRKKLSGPTVDRLQARMGPTPREVRESPRVVEGTRKRSRGRRT